MKTVFPDILTLGGENMPEIQRKAKEPIFTKGKKKPQMRRSRTVS